MELAPPPSRWYDPAGFSMDPGLTKPRRIKYTPDQLKQIEATSPVKVVPPMPREVRKK